MDLAIQIARTGFTYAQSPTSRQLEDIVGMFVGWPRLASMKPNPEVQEQLLVKKAILHLLRNSAAERVLLAKEDGVPPCREVGTRSALDEEGCAVVDMAPHPDGAVGLMRAWTGQFVKDEARIWPIERPAFRKIR